MFNSSDLWASSLVHVLGQGRSISVGAATTRNGVALRHPGRYLFRVTAGAVLARSGDGTVVASATDMRFDAGDSFYHTPADNGHDFVAFIQVSGASTVVVCGVDQDTAGSQPPVWA